MGDDQVPADAQPVPARITMALDMRGLYGPDVDVACGVVEPAVDEWELGLRVPTREQVRALAALTGMPVAFFYLPEEPAGTVIICRRGRGKGRRCERVDTRPVPPAARNPGQGLQGALW